MKSILINKHGGPEVLDITESKIPECPDNKVQVKIYASSINHLDLWIRRGIPSLKITFPHIMGSDAAGKVVKVGKNVKKWKKGDSVVIQPGLYCSECTQCLNNKEHLCINYHILGESMSGIQSQYVNLHSQNIYKMPNHLSYIEAASMPLVFMTAYEMLINRAKLQANQKILIYGGSSGIGSAAIQIARKLNCSIYTTIGNEDKIDYIKKLGCNNILIHSKHNWYKELNNMKFDVIFEHIGKKTWDISLKLLNRGGTIVLCGATTGSNVVLNLKHLFYKQQSILGSTMGSIESFKNVIKGIEQKYYIPFVDKVFPINKIAEAHNYIENRQNKGKVVVSML